jgi:hypothetical protein
MLKIERAAALQPAMIVYRTSADPAFVDLSIDTDDRLIGSYQSQRPDRDNYGNGGFARFTTPRAWLSTWSLFNSNALQARNLPRFRDPFLMVHGQADVSTRLSEAAELFERSVSGDKSFRSVAALNHFGQIVKPDGTHLGASSAVFLRMEASGTFFPSAFIGSTLRSFSVNARVKVAISR